MNNGHSGMLHNTFELMFVFASSFFKQNPCCNKLDCFSQKWCQKEVIFEKYKTTLGSNLSSTVSKVFNTWWWFFQAVAFHLVSKPRLQPKKIIIERKSCFFKFLKFRNENNREHEKIVKSFKQKFPKKYFKI